ncbi:MAG TPA: long-chain fatty acid--CoA ligase, partial [Nitriliruptorales bacterium]|nr:long-chain fatty acid--CoA ligase [Nitriliruptorales bacterium]
PRRRAVDTGTPDLAARLRDVADRTPDRTALLWQDRQVTYAELDRRVDAAAGGLQRLGAGPGDRVALMLGNTPHFVEAYLGALRAGATAVPVNTALTAPEVEHILTDSGARVMVAAESVGPVLDHLPRAALEHLIVAGGRQRTAAALTSTWQELLDRGDPLREAQRHPDEVAVLLYTSGTTGRPKGAMLTRRNLAANQDQVLATPLAVRTDDVVLTVLPLFHVYALNVGLGSVIRVGATLVLTERFDPVRTLDLLDRHGVTVVLGAPPMYIAWLNTPGVTQAGWPRVRVAVSGAAPLSAAVLERFRDTVGITIWEGYGLTEAAPAVTSTAVARLAKPGSVGRPLPGVELRLVDEQGRDVETGDPGEVWVRGPNVFPGYWGDAAATEQAFAPGGWLRTGDIGILDGEGDLRLVDRKKDLIIVSGFNVYPREVEEALHRHPEVVTAAVVGIDHPYTGEAVKAFVVAREGSDLTEDEVVSWCRGRLARFKCPQAVTFVDELPVTSTGKVRRVQLRST